MQEPIREQSPQQPQGGRPPEPLRPTGPPRVAEVAPLLQASLVEWGPTWGGAFIALGVLLLLGSLGVAIGVGAGTTGVAIWGGFSIIVAFFVGGWFTGRTLNVFGSMVSAAHGLLVWSVTTVFAVVFTIVTTLIGIGSAAAAARALIEANVLAPIANVAAPAAPGATTATTSSWATFVILILGVAAAIIGASVGNRGRPSVTPRQ